MSIYIFAVKATRMRGTLQETWYTGFYKTEALAAESILIRKSIRVDYVIEKFARVE